MGRPRLHSPDAVLDVAELLAAEGGAAAVTIRAVAERSGASTGSIYHAFASREAILAATWLRAARRFLALQRTAVDEALAAGGSDAPVAATVAAALTLRDLGREHPATARLLTTQRREALLTADVPADLADALRGLDGELLTLLRDLARALWDRADRVAVETVAVCVVDLPTATLVPRRPQRIDPAPLLEAAVRATLAVPLPPARRRQRA